MAKDPSVFDQYLKYLTLEKQRAQLVRSRAQAAEQLRSTVAAMRDALAKGSDGLQFKSQVEQHHDRLTTLDKQISLVESDMGLVGHELPAEIQQPKRPDPIPVR